MGDVGQASDPQILLKDTASGKGSGGRDILSVCSYTSLVLASKPKLLSGDIPVPHFRRGRQESEKAYINRMTQATEHVLFLTNNQLERQPEVELKEEEKTEEKKPTKKNWLVWHALLINTQTAK